MPPRGHGPVEKLVAFGYDVDRVEVPCRQPDRLRTDRAASLSNLSAGLAGAGRRGGRLAAIEEAVQVRRRLAAAGPPGGHLWAEGVEWPWLRAPLRPWKDPRRGKRCGKMTAMTAMTAEPAAWVA